MPAMETDSDSSLSSAPEEEVRKLAPIFVKAKKATKLVAPPPAASPPRPKRAPSPPHEEVLADNPDIAFIAMFRSRFQEAFPGKTPHYGPQDIERGVVDHEPSPEVQTLLCALLGLVLNRKKPVERGHYGRALEEAVQTHKSQWPLKWAYKNPLHGGKSFETMLPVERLDLLRALTMWALGSSEVVSGMIKDKYKQVRHSDDLNQPLSVQPWGTDGDKRRYFLIQGLDDTNFRVYREGSRYTRNAHWWSVAGSIDEVLVLAEKLEKEDGTQAARRLATQMRNAVPMFEATEEKRRRREYRQQRRAAFTRPEPGFGIYEGRTRGKRMRYTYEEDDDALDSDATSTRRSTRQQSGRSTPFEAGPTYTASGRQIKQPRTGDYGESLLSSNVMNIDDLAPGLDGRETSHESDAVHNGGRATRSGGARSGVNDDFNSKKRKHIDGYNSIDEMSDEEEVDEWDSDKNGDEEKDPMLESDSEDANSKQSHAASDDDDDTGDGSTNSLIIKLRVPKVALTSQKYTPPTSPPSAGSERPKTEEIGRPMISGSSVGAGASVIADAIKLEAVPNGSAETVAMDATPVSASVPSAASAYETKVTALPASSSATTQYPKPTEPQKRLSQTGDINGRLHGLATASVSNGS